MIILNVEDISLKLGDKLILNKLNFSLKDKQVLSILGQSGSGKSTILRIVAGLLKPSEGLVKYKEKIISTKTNCVPTGERNIGLMFQEDVLFPNLTVFENVAFGVRSLIKKNKNTLVNNYLREFGIYDKKNRYPSSLSGGEKQRVALARVLITKPNILLMDEPFSNLDNNLRKEICDYTISTLKKNKISVIFVTHDIEEALRVSDKIIIIKNGKIIQHNSPKKLYEQPNSRFVASLLGSVNQFEVLSDEDGQLITPFGTINCSNTSKTNLSCKGKKHFCIIRPENLFLGNKGIDSKIIDKFFLGSSWSYKIKLKECPEVLYVANCKKEFEKNQEVKVHFNKKNILIFQE